MAEWKANKTTKESRGSQKWKPKDADAAAPEAESKEESPVSAGPRYDKLLMLQVFRTIQSGGAETSDNPEMSPAESKEEEAPAEASELAYKVEERPTPDGTEEGGRTPGLRRSLREQKRAKKAAAAAEVGDEAIKATTSEVTRQASVGGAARQSLDLGAATPAASPTAAGFGMPMYPPVYPGMYPPYAAPSPPAPPPPAAGASAASPLSTALPKATAKSMVLLRHVPAGLTRENLVELLNKDYKGTFDFVYLPGSTKKKGGGNRGYAFINFRRKVDKFTAACHGVAPSVALGTPEEEGEKCLAIEEARLPTLNNTLTEMAKKPRPEAAPWQPLLFDETGQAKPFPLSPPPPPPTGGETSGAAPVPHMPPFGSPYPPYPGLYNHAYMMVADVHRRAAVAAWAAVGRQLTDKTTPPMSEEMKNKLREQIEYYFSDDNLCKDLFLRQHMNHEGWTPLELIAHFPKVKEFNVTDQQILEVVKESKIIEVEVSTLYLRLKDERNRSKWTKEWQATAKYRSQVYSAAMMQSYTNFAAFQVGAAQGKGGGRRRKTDGASKGGSKSGKGRGKGAASDAVEGEKPKADQSAAPPAEAAAEPAATVTAGGDS